MMTSEAEMSPCVTYATPKSTICKHPEYPEFYNYNSATLYANCEADVDGFLANGEVGAKEVKVIISAKKEVVEYSQQALGTNADFEWFLAMQWNGDIGTLAPQGVGVEIYDGLELCREHWPARLFSLSLPGYVSYSIAESGRKPTGFIHLFETDTELNIVRVIVLLEGRQKGLATELLNHVFRKHSEKDNGHKRKVFVGVDADNVPALNLYYKNDFQARSAVYSCTVNNN